MKFVALRDAALFQALGSAAEPRVLPQHMLDELISNEKLSHFFFGIPHLQSIISRTNTHQALFEAADPVVEEPLTPVTADFALPEGAAVAARHSAVKLRAPFHRKLLSRAAANTAYADPQDIDLHVAGFTFEDDNGQRATGLLEDVFVVHYVTNASFPFVGFNLIYVALFFYSCLQIDKDRAPTILLRLRLCARVGVFRTEYTIVQATDAAPMHINPTERSALPVHLIHHCWQGGFKQSNWSNLL